VQLRYLASGLLLLCAFAAVSIVTYFDQEEVYYTVDELAELEPLGHLKPSSSGVLDSSTATGGSAGAAAASMAEADGGPEPSRRMHVRGIVDDESVSRPTGELSMSFDLLGDRGRVPVVYEGIVPDTFDMAEEVTVGGHLRSDGVFKAEQLFVQCPSKYEAVPPGAEGGAGHPDPDATAGYSITDG